MIEPSQEAKQAALSAGYGELSLRQAYCEGYDTATAKAREELAIVGRSRESWKQIALGLQEQLAHQQASWEHDPWAIEDKERLDWLEKNWGKFNPINTSVPFPCQSVLRAAIDEAKRAVLTAPTADVELAIERLLHKCLLQDDDSELDIRIVCKAAQARAPLVEALERVKARVPLPSPYYEMVQAALTSTGENVTKTKGTK